ACPYSQDESGFRLLANSIFKNLLRANFIPTSASMFRAPVARTIGGYDTRLNTSEDREFLLRLCRRGAVGYVPKSLAQKREGHVSLTSDHASIHVVKNGLLCLLYLKENLDTDGLMPDEISEIDLSIQEAAERFSYDMSKCGYWKWRKE